MRRQAMNKEPKWNLSLPEFLRSWACNYFIDPRNRKDDVDEYVKAKELKTDWDG